MNRDDEAWLLEHLFYEWGMLNYTIGRIQQLPEGNEWNAHYESFAVHARLINLFLTNGDTGNYGAKDFVQNFRSDKTSLSINLMNKINPQVLHLSEKRSALTDHKLDSGECVALFRWLGVEFFKFLDGLEPDTRAKWDAKAGGRPLVLLTPGPPNSTNHVHAIMTSTTTVYYSPG